MDDSAVEILFESIKRGMEINPCYYKLYIMLGEYYIFKGKYKQAYIALRQARLYCDDPVEMEEIGKKQSEVISLGGVVPGTAIIVLSWNLHNYTAQCINSIRQTTVDEDTQIIVVDNASVDGSIEWLRQQEDILLKCNDKNEGFPKGCNQGIELADPDADIFLLNNDTVLPPNALFWLKIALYENDSIGSTGAMSNYVSNNQMIEKEFISPSEVLDYAMSHNIPMQYPYEPKIYLVGFALLMKRTALDKVGFLDERFSPGNCEDIDIGIRMRMAGYENILCKNSVILHFGSQSFDMLGDEFKSVMLKNIDRLNEKYRHNMRYYLFPRKELIEHFSEDTKETIRVLELGCGSGATMAWIRGKYPTAQVYGIEIVEDMARIASSVGEVICGDVECMEYPYELAYFDYIVMGDVLEHLHEPMDVLIRLHDYLKPDGRIVLSMPNMKHWTVMIPLLVKDEFRYVDAGILDRTHLRMYTKHEILRLVETSGYRVEKVCENRVEDYPKEYESIIEILKSFDESDNRGAYEVYQYIVVAKKL